MLFVQAIERFLLDLTTTNKSPQTRRVYRADLTALAQIAPIHLAQLDVEHLRQFFAQYHHLKPATRARKQAAVASFLRWAYQQDLIDSNPMLKIQRIQPEQTPIQAPSRAQVEAILHTIPSQHLRDRLLFRLLFETGLRISEALAIHIEDINFTPDDEHLTVVGKGGRHRTILLDDTALVALLKRYIQQQGYQHGALFRAHKNYRGGALRYQSVQAKWAGYCQQAGIICTLHQLRHAHATELVNDGVSLATIRRRLGHKHIQTTLRYAQQFDTASDAEIRNWRRRRQSR